MKETITRREFIAGSAATAMGLALGPNISAAELLAEKKRPNILFIMTDQQSAGMMSCMGNKWLKTPAMDRLVASGVRFENAYACNPVCVPSRVSLQTGFMPSRIGMSKNNDLGWPGAIDYVARRSLGNVFANAGYETVYGGKVHLPGKMSDIRNLGYRFLTNDRREKLADTCVEFLKGPHTKPFLMFASFINPHDICYVSINDQRRALGLAPAVGEDSEFCETMLDVVRKSPDIKAFIEEHAPPLPSNFAIPEREPECITTKYAPSESPLGYIREKWTADQWRLCRWAYCRLTEAVDESIGRVLDSVREAGLEDNTLIVFTSDHGELDAAHRLEGKSVLYDECMHIPFVMSYKGVIPTGAVDNRHLISNGLDLLPTLCDYAGIKAPGGLPGASVRPLIERKTGVTWRDSLVVESQDGRAIRTERYKYCVYDSGKRREQLTDLKNDPGEMKNLAEDPTYKTVLGKHRRLLRNWVEKTSDRIGSEYIIGAHGPHK
jgi:arylsulfatase A-like enzyme